MSDVPTELRDGARSALPWQTLARQAVATYGPYLTLEAHTVQISGGRVIRDWPWIITPDFATVVPVRADGRFLFFRQGKYGIEGESLAPPGGFLEPGEEPLEGARRELLEETGCTADAWVSLGRYRVDPNRGAGTGHLFLARGATRTAEVVPDDLEAQEPVLLTCAQVERALDEGEFKALAWAAAVALALRHVAAG